MWIKIASASTYQAHPISHHVYSTSSALPLPFILSRARCRLVTSRRPRRQAGLLFEVEGVATRVEGADIGGNAAAMDAVSAAYVGRSGESKCCTTGGVTGQEHPSLRSKREGKLTTTPPSSSTDPSCRICGGLNVHSIQSLIMPACAVS